MSKVPVGVIGVGRLGAEHARILSDLGGSRLVGVQDVDADRSRSVAARAGTEHFRRRGELLERARAVVVAVPTAEHHAVASEALEAGCHVLVEKPLAGGLEQATDLVRAAAERNLRLGVGHVERFNPAVRAARAHVGRPRFLESRRLAPFQTRGTDVSVVLDLMIHDIDLALSLTDDEVVGVDAEGVSVVTDSVDTASAHLRFGDGAVAQLTASRVSAGRIRRLRAFQASGTLTLDLEARTGAFHVRRAGGPLREGAEGGRGRTGLDGALERVSIVDDGREPLRLELEGFLEAVRTGAGTVVTGEEARRALEIALRITREIGQSTHVPARHT